MNGAAHGRPAHFVAWLIGERLVRGLVTVIALAAVARHLQPAGFGVLNFSNAVVSLMIPLAQLGLDTVLVRDLVRQPSKTGELLGTSFALRALAGIVFALMILGAARVSSIVGAAQPALGPMSLIIVVQAGEVADCWFRSRVHSRPVVLIRGTVIVLGAGVKLLLVGLGAGLVAFAWVYAVEAAAFVAGLVIYSRLGPNPPPAWRFEASLAGKLVREGAGFALAGFLGGLALRIDQIAVSAILGDADSGLYYGALRIMEIPVFVATTTAASLFPALAIAESDPLMHERLETVFGIMSVLAWATAIGTTIAGPWLIPLLLGPSYAGAWPALVIQAWASLFLFSGMIRTNYLALRSAPGAQIGIASLTLAGQVVLNMALVPRFGISGAAASFLLAQAINAWLLPFGFASLRPCLGPQFRSVLSPFSPARWREFVAIVRGDITKAQTQ